MKHIRIGHGFDIHRFEEGKPLKLGGVRIPEARGMKGHSDGDVILHALCDALLGALALGDIGQYFPETDPRWAGADSRTFLREILTFLKRDGYEIQNIDITVLAEFPKLMPYREKICQTIADALRIARHCVNVKAKTMEKLGPIGAEEALAAHVVCLLAHSPS